MCNEISILLHILLLAFPPQEHHRLVRPAPIGWHINATSQRAQ
jgi:hypothetical protein